MSSAHKPADRHPWRRYRDPLPDKTTGLYCQACGLYLGDNNAPIKEGPHTGYRPTELTQYCVETGQREAVIESKGPPVWCGYCDEFTDHETANCVLPIVN